MEDDFLEISQPIAVEIAIRIVEPQTVARDVERVFVGEVAADGMAFAVGERTVEDEQLGEIDSL